MGACNIINPEEPIPAYLHIPALHLSTDPEREGSASSRFNDVWVFVTQAGENADLGAYPLPATIPVLNSGEDVKVTLAYGILLDGKAVERVIYPLVFGIDTTVALQPGRVDTLRPFTTYKEGAQFALLENFEQGNNLQGSGVTSDQSMVFEGNRSAWVQVSAGDALFTVNTPPFEFEERPQYVFLEMDYRFDGIVDVLLEHEADGFNTFEEYLVTLSAKDTWNKVYINLSPSVATSGSADFKVLFKQKTPAGDKASFLWDNLKIIHL